MKKAFKNDKTTDIIIRNIQLEDNHGNHYS